MSDTQICCHVGCENKAEFMIVGEMGIGYDDTYMCPAHVNEHACEGDTVEPM